MQRKIGTISDASNNPISGVTVTVKIAGTATNATLFSDNIRTSLGNPFTNDSNGSFEFYAANGRYDLVFTKTGATFQGSDSTDVVLFDPADASDYVHLRCEFLCSHIDSDHYTFDAGFSGRLHQGALALTLSRGGTLQVIEAAGSAGWFGMDDHAGTFLTPFGVTTDIMVLEQSLEKVGDAVAGTRRAGFGSAELNSDPANGIYVRQIDANNAFVVSRSGSTESTLDLGQTLNARSKVRLLIATGEIRVLLDNVSKGTITTNIPTALMGYSLYGGAVASAAGIEIDYLDIWMKR